MTIISNVFGDCEGMILPVETFYSMLFEFRRLVPANGGFGSFSD